MKLKPAELSEYLDIPMDMLGRWIRQGRIPVSKAGEELEFNENTLKKWAMAHHLSYRPKKKAQEQPEQVPEEQLLTVMQRGGVLYDVEGDDPSAVIQSVVSQLTHFTEEARELLFERLMEREKMMSTGIGKGIAIPHPRTPLEHVNKSIIITGFLKNPVQFNAIDNQPVTCLFVILSLSIKMHLHLLSRLTFFLRQDPFISFLKNIPDEVKFYGRIGKMEKQLLSKL